MIGTLHLENIAPIKPQARGGGPGGDADFSEFQMLKAVASRYHGIGGNRVTLNYEHFVTVYDAGYGIDVFNGSDVGDDNGNLDQNVEKDECSNDWKHPR